MLTVPVRKPTSAQWNHLIKPEPGQAEPAVLKRRADEPLPASIDEFRQQVAALDYLPLDPFVASVGGSISANQVELPKGEQTVAVSVPEYYRDDVEVMLGVQNGPGAPMLLILPGIHSGGDSSHNLLLRKLALERGMNYVALPNSMNDAMLEDQPVYHPGNPRVDALATRQILQQLKTKFPEYFQSISVAGYSYGALHGANLIRADEESSDRLIDGGLVAISPPENLDHSMRQLDGLRQVYTEEGSATIADTGVLYKHDVKKFGYAGFMDSSLSKHGPGTNVDEIEIADKYGSRDGLKNLVERIDKQFGHNQLPMNTPEYQQANPLEKLRLRNQHKKIVDNITYDQFSDGWVCKDQWLQEQHLTPEEMAAKYSFSEAIKAVHDTPILMVGATDDYILAPQDVDRFQHLETGDKEIARMFSTGGHVSLDWNPKVAETLIDFAVAAPNLRS